MMTSNKPLATKARLGGIALISVALLLVGSSNLTKPAGAASSSTVTFAMPPDSPATDIFPLLSSAQYSNVNLNEFTKFMYTPLYWIGNGSKIVVDESRSIADPPVWSGDGKVVTVKLKKFTWSN